MAQVIDLSQRLTNERPTIRIDDNHIYEVNNSKNTAIALKEIFEDKSIKDFAKNGDKTDRMIEIALGKAALEYLKSKDYSPAGWNLIIEAIMAAINETTLDEIEETAKKEQVKQIKEFRK